MDIAVDRIAIEQALMFAEDARLAELVRPILDRMLGDGKSSIDPSYTIWTTETAEDLRARIEDNLQEGAERNFFSKNEATNPRCPGRPNSRCARHRFGP